MSNFRYERRPPATSCTKRGKPLWGGDIARVAFSDKSDALGRGQIRFAGGLAELREGRPRFDGPAERDWPAETPHFSCDKGRRW
jgi:hypothetical protein